MRRGLIVGNWKMNGSLLSNAVLLRSIKDGLDPVHCDVVVCAPLPYLDQCKSVLSLSEIAWGAQNLSSEEYGAFTGEVSAAMLVEFGCRYAIVGHSERRAQHGESDADVAKKVVRALSSGLIPIVCVGETLVEHDSGMAVSVVVRQIDAVLSAISADDVARVVVAYEPVWAIGTGQTATPKMAQQVHEVLRLRLAGLNPAVASEVRIIYGGSMKPDNAKALLAMPDIDGGLIGGASLKAADFLAIIRAVD